jgi:hypothetical protein
MTFDQFNETLADKNPPAVNDYLRALLYDAKGDWEKSHKIIQDIETKEGAHIHAYLHRKEGDDWNADYWYAKAGKKRPSISLDQELKELVNLYGK